MKPIHKLIIVMAILLTAIVLRGPDGGTNRHPAAITR